MATRSEVNARLKPVDIRGKKYAPVNERILAFWELFPNGSITTEWIELTDDRAICKATVCGDGGTVLATGTASEVRTASNINRTSYIENCETSAVGRALGLAGVGTDGSIASAEEMLMALNSQQDQPAKPVARKPTKKKQPEAKQEQEAEQAMTHEEATGIYMQALADYAAYKGTDPKDTIAKQEAHYGQPIAEWPVQRLLDVASKFPRG